MKRFLLIVKIALIVFSATGQPYQLNWKTDGILLGSSAVMGGVTLALDSRFIPLSPEEIAGLNPQDINQLDRSATKHFSDAANRRSHFGERVPLVIGSLSPLIIPVISDHHEWDAKEMFTILLIWGETNLVSATGTHMLKNWTKRARPYVYHPDVSMEMKQSENARKSFISGHTTTSAANTFFLAKVFSDYFPESRLKPLAWSLAAAIPAWTGIERYLAGKHFPTDIIPGYIFGAACGFFIPHLHRTGKTSNVVNLDIYPYSNFGQNGLQLVLNFN